MDWQIIDHAPYSAAGMHIIEAAQNKAGIVRLLDDWSTYWYKVPGGPLVAANELSDEELEAFIAGRQLPGLTCRSDGRPY